MERERTSALKESVECQAAVVDRVVAEKACLQSDVSMLRIDNDRLKAKLADMELWDVTLLTYLYVESYELHLVSGFNFGVYGSI